MPPVASRRGRRIASKACDTCRVRKVQCIFEREDSTVCRRCGDGGIDCTFLSDRKQRGPAARRTPTINLTISIGDVCIEHLCPKSAFRTIVDDFLYLVFPVLPIIHRPSFRNSINNALYTRDPAFLRLCLAICAATIASVPRKFSEYSCDRYTDVGAMVDRACRLVMLSRIATEPEWQNHPSMDTVIVSLLLAIATHYVGRTNQGWAYASEATHCFRALELYRKGAYEGLSVMKGELCKRAFWLLYIMQIHDRLSFTVPHTGLSFDPVRTDWEFLLPAEIEDEDMADTTLATEYESKSGIGSQPTFGVHPPPVISGFVSLVRVFLCVVDLLSNGFPGSAPAFAMTSGTLRKQIYPDNPIDTTTSNISSPTTSSPRPSPKPKSNITLTDLLRVIRKLQTTIEDLPPILKIPTTTVDPQLETAAQSGTTTQTYTMPAALTNQFNIMRANIHITSLYIQSSILEACSSTLYHFPRPSTYHTDPSYSISPATDDTTPSGILNGSATSPDTPTTHAPRTQLWSFRKSIAKELLGVLHFCTQRVLEANGSSMIVKIREIAATLLDTDFDASLSASTSLSMPESESGKLELGGTEQHLDEQSRLYVAEFAEILAQLDHLGRVTVTESR